MVFIVSTLSLSLFVSPFSIKDVNKEKRKCRLWRLPPPARKTSVLSTTIWRTGRPPGQTRLWPFLKKHTSMNSLTKVNLKPLIPQLSRFYTTGPFSFNKQHQPSYDLCDDREDEDPRSLYKGKNKDVWGSRKFYNTNIIVGMLILISWSSHWIVLIGNIDMPYVLLINV